MGWLRAMTVHARGCHIGDEDACGGGSLYIQNMTCSGQIDGFDCGLVVYFKNTSHC